VDQSLKVRGELLDAPRGDSLTIGLKKHSGWGAWPMSEARVKMGKGNGERESKWDWKS